MESWVGRSRCSSSGSAWPRLALLNGAIFAFQRTRLGEETLVDLAVPTGSAIDRGEIWRPLTSLFVHPGGLIHLGINTALLGGLGTWAEQELGRSTFVASYLGAGFTTNAVRYALGGRTGGGASAAILAVAGAASTSRLHRTGHAGQSKVAVCALIGGGSIIAATVGDGHVLALGVGGALGGAAVDSPEHGRFLFRVSGVIAGGLMVMLGRSLFSSRRRSRR